LLFGRNGGARNRHLVVLEGAAAVALVDVDDVIGVVDAESASEQKSEKQLENFLPALQKKVLETLKLAKLQKK
jgi:hypothetical protein